MSDATPKKPGLWTRLLGLEPDPAPAPDLGPASRSEGVPDFVTSADQIPAAPPSATEAGPDGAPSLPDELAGATLQPVEQPADPSPAGAASNWWQRLRSGMRLTSTSLGEGVGGLLGRRKLDPTTLEDLEDVLVRADLGIEVAARITDAIARGRYDRQVGPDDVRAVLAAEVERTLTPIARPLVIDPAHKPFVVLMTGVNGAGKTTTIGKLAHKFRAQGLSVMLAAGDTFRAAAIDQLRIWGERTGAPVISGAQGAAAAGLAVAALPRAREDGRDVLMIDTAGRLQNRTELMAELEKIIRVIRKFDPSAPHATLLVLDATVGQNALSQVELFRKAADVTGLVMTKLDGTARGGVLVALAAKFGLPVHFIGVGEGIDDLEPFAARDFARAIAGLD